ncbi:MAG TPA: adenylyltransferase/cytidyltransferase family protein [Acidimicrobiales bacterium]|nr:adenylyltransferase/cytidyltransferase family protein [Acidimicrobiales bacterium]
MKALSLRWWMHPPDHGDTAPTVVTGVFDVLHAGHVRFLTWARHRGRPVYVGIEDDERVAAMKGPDRPVNHLEERAEVLAALRPVDAVFLISGPPDLVGPDAYVELLRPLAPGAFAFTDGDPFADAKRQGAAALGADVLEFPHQRGLSTSAVLDRLEASS